MRSVKTSLFKRTALLYAAGLCLFGFVIWQNFKTNTATTLRLQQAVPIVATQAAAEKTDVVIQGEPVHLVLPRLGIELTIVRAEYDANTNSWPVSATAANYAVNTPPISNRADKTLIYAHAQKNLFAATSDLKTGDDLYITTADGHVVHYQYANQLIVPPSDVSIFDQLRGVPGVILMTCDGVWSENRRFMEFTYKGYV